jgi:2-iminobutanoate/2-iminopropanoate deaminase
MKKTVVMVKEKFSWLTGRFIAHANMVGDLVYTMGVGADDYKGDIKKQTEETLRNLEYILKEAGSSLANVLKVTVFLSDMRNYDSMNDAYLKFFPVDPPARTCVEVKGPGAPRGQLVEIEAVAAKL